MIQQTQLHHHFFQDVRHISGYQDIFFPFRHRSTLSSPALPWEEDRPGHSRGSQRHQQSGCHPGSSANSTCLQAADSPD